MIKTILALAKGLKITWQHLWIKRKYREVVGIKNTRYFDNLSKEGVATIQYPHQKLEVPEVGRYQLDVTINDCIVCGFCAKICPANCIDIEVIKSSTDIGFTSDGNKKRLYAAKFDIDMAKCMFCGLCTIVCPTECIVMTNQYDKTVHTVAEINYTFATMTEDEIQQRKQEYEQFLKEKELAKAIKPI